MLKNKDAIIAAVEREGRNVKAKSLKGSTSSDLEKAVFDWFVQQRAQGVPVSGPMIQQKADMLALRMGLEFKASRGWLDRFKNRHIISSHKISGESEAIPAGSVEKWLPVLQSILKRYKPCNVFNADETAMFFNLLPDRTLAVKGDPCKGCKRSKERLTVLLCANMDGSEKRNPLVIGKFKKPRAFKGHTTLPCDYDYNTKAWVTSAMFTRWVRAFDNHMGCKNRMIVLFVDNCPAHPHIQNLRNIELVFLPPNTTSALQPLDQGIIRCMKMHFASRRTASVVRDLDMGRELKKWDVFKAMLEIKAAWNKISSETIRNCFRHAHFSVSEAPSLPLPAAVADEDVDDPDFLDDVMVTEFQPGPSSAPQPGPSSAPQPGPSSAPLPGCFSNFSAPCDDAMWTTIAPDCTYEEYVCAADEVAVWGERGDDDFIGQPDSSDDGENEEERTARPSKEDCVNALQVLENLLDSQLDVPESVINSLENLQCYVTNNVCKQKQASIRDYFKR